MAATFAETRVETESILRVPWRPPSASSAAPWSDKTYPWDAKRPATAQNEEEKAEAVPKLLPRPTSPVTSKKEAGETGVGTKTIPPSTTSAPDFPGSGKTESAEPTSGRTSEAPAEVEPAVDFLAKLGDIRERSTKTLTQKLGDEEDKK